MDYGFQHERAVATDGWHSLVCITRSGPAINARHHAVVRLLADAAALLKVPARVEPYNLCDDDDSRPDVQLDLPEYSLLADVTISHPCAARWRALAAARGVEAVGDARCAEKDGHYVPMADALGVRFAPFVLYTYGGFHKSALSVIEQLGAAYDPAVALVSLSEWKQELKDRIAMCVQRHTANIVIEDAGRARAAGVARHGRRARRSGARRRLPVSVLSPRRPAAAQERREGSARAASLCASLLVSSPASCSAGPAVRGGHGDLSEDMPVCMSRRRCRRLPSFPGRRAWRWSLLRLYRLTSMRRGVCVRRVPCVFRVCVVPVPVMRARMLTVLVRWALTSCCCRAMWAAGRRV